MILCLDVGNTHILGGIFKQDKITLHFRYETKPGGTSDQIGVFLRNVLKENGIQNNNIKQIAICSVVPSLDYSLRAACIKYFDINPFFLAMGAKTGIQIKTKNPNETGADLVATAIGAVAHYPKQNIIVADFGTATTLSAISANKEFLGAAFLPGIRLAMNSLESNTSKLSAVEIIKPKNFIGVTTKESIQSGIYYSHLGTLREIISGMTHEAFTNNKPVIIGTGGFAHLFEDEKIFTKIMPNLVLEGLHSALKHNS
jgi:type III pantothenate kinase